MTSPVRITEECAGLADAIAAVTRAAFAAAYGSGDGEAALIAALRVEGAVVAEVAALSGAEVVGHAMFSRLTVDRPKIGIAALAPVCAAIGRQRAGIGGALIRAGLELCRTKGFVAVAVLGDPAYYGRFGFHADLGARIASPFAGPHFQALELVPGALDGATWRVTYPRAFLAV